MNVGAVNILAAAAVGLGATLLMDLWNLFLNRAFRIPSLNYCLLGRWLRHMPGGTFRHANITAAPHTVFGIGLYVWALGVSYVLRPASGE